MIMKIYKLAWGCATSKSGDKNSFTPYPAAVILHQIQPHGLNTAIITASINLEKKVYHIRPKQHTIKLLQSSSK